MSPKFHEIFGVSFNLRQGETELSLRVPTGLAIRPKRALGGWYGSKTVKPVPGAVSLATLPPLSVMIQVPNIWLSAPLPDGTGGAGHSQTFSCLKAPASHSLRMTASIFRAFVNQDFSVVIGDTACVARRTTIVPATLSPMRWRFGLTQMAMNPTR
jgi:hypothetical protein